jgi:hypothetical protein
MKGLRKIITNLIHEGHSLGSNLGTKEYESKIPTA